MLPIDTLYISGWILRVFPAKAHGPTVFDFRLMSIENLKRILLKTS
jgi:hypothetical protein